MGQQPATRYQALYQKSLNNPERFWGEAAAAIDWFTPYQQVLDNDSLPSGRWFRGGRLNTCYNALDRHVAAGRGDQCALIYDSPVTSVTRHYSYSGLLSEVARFAGVLRAFSVEPGDRVVIYLPMIPQAVIAMLACARIGAIHSVVFGGFAAHELASRIDDAKPVLVLSASCGIEGQRIVEYKPLLDKALHLCRHQPRQCIIYQRPQAAAQLQKPRDVDWQDALEQAEAVNCVAVAATDPLYILYTSGTTGKPKGIVRDNGGHAVALRWSMEYVYNIKPGEVFWAASDVGWVVGHSYIVYGPLLHGCTTVLFEGKPVGTPDPGAFWRVIRQHRVAALFTAPTAFRAIKKEDPRGDCLAMHPFSSLRALFLAGERCDPDTLNWAQDMLNVPVVDHWWQTETGWPVVANCLGIEPLPIKPGSPTRPVPGYDVQVLNETGERVAPGQMGNIAIKLPLPPGCLPTLWGDEARYRDAYLARYPGYYLSGDAGHIDEDGYLFIMSRIDDVINVAGHRLSTGAIEGVLAAHPAVAECAVIGVADALKGQLPVGLVVLKNGVAEASETIARALIQAVRDEIGPVASFKRVAVVARLPKTRSGKMLRGTMRSIADGRPYTVPATIDDPVILDEITAALRELGLAAPTAGVA